MTWRRYAISALLCTLLGLCTAQAPLRAQETPADTAAILVRVARGLDIEGRRDLAEELLRYVMEHYRGTAAAQEAQQLLEALVGIRQAGSGRVQFVVWNTVFAIWLGLAVPAAFGADEPEPFGAGLLLAGPSGFLASRAYTRGRPITSGQAGAYTLATVWGTYQALGWRSVLDIGEEEFCDPPFGCFTSTSDEAPWRAAVLGGLAGIGTGLVLANKNISAGDITLADHAAVWGTWYGLALGIILDQEDDALLAYTLLGGDAGILAAIPAARAWKPTRAQVRLASIAGLAAGVAGLGLDLLFQVEDEKAAVAIPTVTATLGLIAVATLTRDRERGPGEGTDGTFGSAFLSVGDGLRVGLPIPLPTAVPTLGQHGKRRLRPAFQIRLFNARF